MNTIISIIYTLFISFVLSKSFWDHLSFVKTINLIFVCPIICDISHRKRNNWALFESENRVNEIHVLWILIVGAISLDITNSNTFEDWARTKSTGTRYCNVCTVMAGCNNCSPGNRNQVAHHIGIHKVYNKIRDVVFIYEITETSHDMEVLSSVCGPLWGNLPVTSQRASNAKTWCFFGVGPSKLFNKHSSGQWSKTPCLSCDTTGGTFVFVIAAADVLGPDLPGVMRLPWLLSMQILRYSTKSLKSEHE